METWIEQLPFRLGTSSYIIPDDILPNARYLAGRVRDIELVLFELDDGLSNIPSPPVITELCELARQNDLTYTVHLPLDLRLGAEGVEQHVSLVKARRVIEATLPLNPWAYVLHLDSSEYKNLPEGEALTPSHELRGWQDQAVSALARVSEWAGGPERLAVENLEGYPLDFLTPVLARSPVSRTVDVGHLWRDGYDPLPYLAAALERTRVIHWHGIGTRDHQSLANMAPAQVDAVLDCLLRTPFTGVVTLEIFNQADLDSSLEMISGEAAVGQSLTFILGGARSGKSTYALDLARERLAYYKEEAPLEGTYHLTFVATGLAFDDEMKLRIAVHRQERPADWYTLEAPTQVGLAIRGCPVTTPVLILDCLTLLANNVILGLPDPENAPADAVQALLDGEIDQLLAAYRESQAEWIVVSNEVGLGLVPPYPLGRVYRDALGRANQRMARAADRVLFMVAGLPMRVK